MVIGWGYNLFSAIFTADKQGELKELKKVTGTDYFESKEEDQEQKNGKTADGWSPF